MRAEIGAGAAVGAGAVRLRRRASVGGGPFRHESQGS